MLCCFKKWTTFGSINREDCPYLTQCGLKQCYICDICDHRPIKQHIFILLLLSEVMEKPLERKAGRCYAPPGNKRLIYFIDDMNMAAVDSYGTSQPHALIRQHLDYKHWLYIHLTSFLVKRDFSCRAAS